MTPIESIAAALANARTVVAFTGAGISTESGIPDFRSPGGIWANSTPVQFHDFLNSEEARYEYWRQKAAAHVEFLKAEPNAGHRMLARWEAEGLLEGVVTQNIDGLHQAAGSKRVWELHGTAREIACLDCGARSDADPLVKQFLAEDRVPDCRACGGLLKHATISFGQTLDAAVITAADEISRTADVYLAIGSSLVVYPAAALPEAAKRSGAMLVIVNRTETPLDPLADYVVRGGIGETLTAIDACWRERRD